MKSRIRRWGAFFLMFAMLLAGLALFQPSAVQAMLEEPGRQAAATATDAALDDGNGSILPLSMGDASTYALTGSKSFTEISRIPYWSRSGSVWQTEVFFVKDSAWSSQANAGNYYWYSEVTADYPTDAKINAFMDGHTVAYCVESGAVTPCDSGSSTAGTLAGSSNNLSRPQKEKLVNIVANGYPANKAYWASKGLNYLEQASATQMAIWYWTDKWGISGNTGAVSPYTITSSNSAMKQMYDYLSASDRIVLCTPMLW